MILLMVVGSPDKTWAHDYVANGGRAAPGSGPLPNRGGPEYGTGVVGGGADPAGARCRVGGGRR